ncbi:MAG: hypothetical protein WBL63_04275 [Candidatus Acidiferrum sp.]
MKSAEVTERAKQEGFLATWKSWGHMWGSFFHGEIAECGTTKWADHEDVLVAEMDNVELTSRLIRENDTELEHGTSPWNKNPREPRRKIRHKNGEGSQGESKEVRK